MSLVEGVEQTGAEANSAISNMLDKSGDVHDAMIALQRAEMTLQLTVQIRNKLVQAYQEVMRMPV
jgi:flagellar hook-basal body complex protein FliE